MYISFSYSNSSSYAKK